MQAGFLQVPDWFSTDNQGCGIAVADLAGNGTQDLVVFMIDNPPGQNRGLYGSPTILARRCRPARANRSRLGASKPPCVGSSTLRKRSMTMKRPGTGPISEEPRASRPTFISGS